MAEIEVVSASGTYPIVVELGSTAGLGMRLRQSLGGSRLMVVADQNTASILGKALADDARAEVFEVEAGEGSKSFASVERACAAAVAAGLDRDSTIIAVGGGVVGDLAGVVAGVYMRGIKLVHVPTTLLAMVDSAIGGKAAVNLPQGKNLVGSFKSPIAVYVDPGLLAGLPDREYRSGLAEVIKYGMIADEQLYDSLLANSQRVLARDADLMTNIISTCCAIKARVVTEDEHETGERAILNYGHTFGHALEAATEYGRFAHGEAISVGMTVAAGLGVYKGVTPPAVANQQAELLEAYGLPDRAPGAATPERVLEAITHDKKTRAGATPWVLLEKLGKATPGHQVGPEVVAGAVRAALSEG